MCCPMCAGSRGAFAQRSAVAGPRVMKVCCKVRMARRRTVQVRAAKEVGIEAVINDNRWEKTGGPVFQIPSLKLHIKSRSFPALRRTEYAVNVAIFLPC